MLDALDAAAVRAWSRGALALLSVHRAEVDALNVFPVPDSDTGANMVSTVRAGQHAVLELPAGAGAGTVLAALAAGSAKGAVGNSGFILSQVLRGVADATAGARTCDAAALAGGLAAGARLGHSAVVDPVEGTILTVARAAADAACEAAESGSLADVATAAYAAAAEALDHTPDQLDALATAGVVDAGGRGLVIVLDALVEVVTGHAPPLARVALPARTDATDGGQHDEGHPRDAPSFGFEVQYLLDAPADAVDTLRRTLAALGDSVVVVPADGGWNVHAHVDDVGAAIEAGVVAGRPHRIDVTRLDVTRLDVVPPAAPPDRGRAAVVALAPGPGLAHLFAREGVHVVDAVTTNGRPVTAADVADAIRAAGVPELVLLPNARRGAGVAEDAADLARADGIRVVVVPTRSPVQGLAAVAVHDPARRFDDDVVAMAEAAAATRYAEITTATEEALTAVGRCQPGDVLGLIEGEVVEVGRGLLAVCFALVDRLLGVGGELMTVLIGADAPPHLGSQVEHHVRSRSPLTDVAVYEGGQTGRPVIIGVE